VVWLFTCGVCGHKHSIRPQPVPSGQSGYQLSNINGNANGPVYGAPGHDNGHTAGRSGPNGYNSSRQGFGTNGYGHNYS